MNDPIYYLHNDVGSIEIEESDIRLLQVDDNEYIHINIRIRGHRRLDETFKVNIELDKELLDYIEFIEADDDEKPYRIMAGERKHFEFKLPVKFKGDHSDIPIKNRLDDFDYVINFVGENSTRKHIRNDLY
ncbi:hypothetical protein [Fusibacter sp. 3D3]|uniref:hypothetical protein n=1 Tax=Fusibacter sp. 3D3 TaxID=1048380 RepID=UPI00111300AB|nr:hypothetical protein [Fusibacter sp. 3D3]